MPLPELRASTRRLSRDVDRLRKQLDATGTPLDEFDVVMGKLQQAELQLAMAQYALVQRHHDTDEAVPSESMSPAKVVDKVERFQEESALVVAAPPQRALKRQLNPALEQQRLDSIVHRKLSLVAGVTCQEQQVAILADDQAVAIQIKEETLADLRQRLEEKRLELLSEQKSRESRRALMGNLHANIDVVKQKIQHQEEVKKLVEVQRRDLERITLDLHDVDEEDTPRSAGIDDPSLPSRGISSDSLRHLRHSSQPKQSLHLPHDDRQPRVSPSLEHMERISYEDMEGGAFSTHEHQSRKRQRADKKKRARACDWLCRRMCCCLSSKLRRALQRTVLRRLPSACRLHSPIQLFLVILLLAVGLVVLLGALFIWFDPRFAGLSACNDFIGCLSVVADNTNTNANTT